MSMQHSKAEALKLNITLIGQPIKLIHTTQLKGTESSFEVKLSITMFACENEEVLIGTSINDPSHSVSHISFQPITKGVNSKLFV